MSRRKTLKQLLDEHVVIGDGAMGTMLYHQGVFLNRCFDELNITNPEMIAEVHRQYVQAGADFVETNTFGANQYKLAKFGLADSLEKINAEGVRIALEAAGDDVLVAASIGPLGIDFSDYGRITSEDISAMYARQIRALTQAGADFLIFETYSNVEEMILAIRTAADNTDIDVLAQISSTEQNVTKYGHKIDEAIARVAAEANVTAVGLNCSIGPSAMLSTLEIIRNVTDKPISVQPNAGMPRDIDGRTIYMCTPEYMAEYAKRFFEKGARIIGGCCGTMPEHVAEMAKAVRPLDKAAGVRSFASVSVAAPEISKGQEPLELAEKSRLGRKLAAGEKVTCIELTPPKGCDLSPIIEKVRLCSEYGIDAVNIPDGPRASSRLSPLVTALKIEQEVDIETILHVCCRDKNVIGMQSDMLGAYTVGLNNVLLITGDPPKLGEYPDATAVFDLDSIALTRVVSDLNRALDIAGNDLPQRISMTIGVGANPVAADMDREIERFHRKVAAGAEYAITQPVFDPESLFRFMDAVSDSSIPIIAGIWPFTSYKNAEFMANEVPGVVVPPALLERMSKAGTREEGRLIGIEIAREMMEKIEDRVAGFAVSAPFGNVRIALAVLGKIAPEDV